MLEITVLWQIRFYFYKIHDYKTRQDDNLEYWVTTDKVIWFFFRVIIYFLMTNKRHTVIPISQVLWTPTLTVWWLMTWNHQSKSHISLCKTFSLFIYFFLLQQCTYGLVWGDYNITLVSKRIGVANIFTSLCGIT